MPQYMLSVHMVEGEEGPPMTQEEMALRMKRIGELEADMRASNTWRFSARLRGPDTATVVRKVAGQRVTSDGPYAESKEHLGGFYVIEAADLDEALDWAERTVDATGMPIEVWPFVATAGQ
ncbi:MAG: YciI family protein [Actinomycetota bacterium]|nr:YciI family protein [Actinomycetota bacterium]